MMHEKGLRLGGAWITGVLDLEGCRVPRDIGLLDCRFEATPVLRSAVIDTLSFDGSDLPGFAADRLEARGDLLFRSATVRGPISPARQRGSAAIWSSTARRWTIPATARCPPSGVRSGAACCCAGRRCAAGMALPGARIGGDLDLIGATLDRPTAWRSRPNSVRSRATWRCAMRRVTGGVSLVTARIGGDVDLTGARYRAPGRHGGEPEPHAGRRARSSCATGARIDGALSLNGANFGAIVDEPACWPAKGDLLLNRCLYGALLGGAVERTTRLDWLSRQTPGALGRGFLAAAL